MKIPLVRINGTKCLNHTKIKIVKIIIVQVERIKKKIKI